MSVLEGWVYDMRVVPDPTLIWDARGGRSGKHDVNGSRLDWAQLPDGSPSPPCRDRSVRLGAGPLLDAGGEFLHLVVGAAALSHFLADLAVRVHDSGVVTATEGLPDPG
jgi:hypothetical protein